jgi:thiol-disulfide isomerase/thioredoxin
MKKYFKIILPFVVLGCLAFLLLGIRAMLKQKRTVAVATVELPEVSFLHMNGDSATLSQESNRVKYLIFFNSDCEHCQAEVALLANYHGAFLDSDVYFFSNEPLDRIRAFAAKYLGGWSGV